MLSLQLVQEETSLMCHVARPDVYVLDNNNNRLQAFQLIGLTRYLLGVPKP